MNDGGFIFCPQQTKNSIAVDRLFGRAVVNRYIESRDSLKITTFVFLPTRVK